MVIRAKVLGYCMGVRRAVDIALKARLTHPNHKIYTLGPLIHNNAAISMLEEKGIQILDKDSILALKNAGCPTLVVLSAHGTPHTIRQSIEDTGSLVVDATCPRVLINQKRITDYAEEGYSIFIVGDKSHGEVIALAGSVPEGSKYFLLQNDKEAKELIEKNTSLKSEKAIVISQTTITQHEYDAVSSVLKTAIDSIIIFETICPATQERQGALKDLFYDVDAVIVVGGKNSANTTRLYQTAKNLSMQVSTTNERKPVCHIETSHEIPKEFFSFKNIGLTAGASTPDEVILEVENSLLNGAKNNTGDFFE